MSALAEEIVKTLGRKKKDPIDLGVEVVDGVLNELGIPTSSSKGVPVRLRAKRMMFSGTKRLAPDHPDAEGFPIEEAAGSSELDVAPGPATANPAPALPQSLPDETSGDADTADGREDKLVRRALVPFHFEWLPQDGVNGLGSERNLRGKSSVLNVLLWSLSGRCSEFSPDVQRWIQHVEVDWGVGHETLRVQFDAADGHATTGTVSLLAADGAVGNVLTTFDRDSFEDAMNSVMLNRLRLDPITVSQSGKPTSHQWPAYTNALWVRPKYLASIIGKEPTLSVRLMQMFIGTDWVPVLAAASTVAGTLNAEQVTAEERTKTATDAVTASRLEAQSKVDSLRSRISALRSGTPDLAKITAASARASQATLEINRIELQKLQQSAARQSISQQLKAAHARQHTEYEDALLTKFFHQMEPTVCPRCTAAVTEERRAAESDSHKCSVCTNDLHLEDVQATVEATSTADTSRSADTEAEDPDPPPRDEIDALKQALEDTDAAISALQDQLAELAEARETATAEAEFDATLLTAAEERQRLELDIARAEGAADALAQPVPATTGPPVDPIQLAVATAAETVLKRWVKDGQDPLLAAISADIERLTISFGGDSLSDVKLDGAANMKLLKGGDPATYGALTPGEQLRVKVATVIALIRHGYVAGLGRHPGLLLLDSPAAEEIPDGDLATMIAALIEVADDAPMQIFVATRNTGPLLDLLPDASRLIATGDQYVW
ncbi:hypothetical protein [Mycobacterium sp. GA-2829]|uniref:hypothetical protein n=1 Tax=Mycobacterium sp. GA-2829 TaxID=1772283 RepID=UPI000ACC8F58|nr:hypothetical protein [Mycobacterium sp. GA-2829]